MDLPSFKLISSNSIDLFQERLDTYLAQLDRDEEVANVAFSTVALRETVEFSALVQTRKSGNGS